MMAKYWKTCQGIVESRVAGSFLSIVELSICESLCLSRPIFTTYLNADQRWRCLSVPAQVNATVKTVIEQKTPTASLLNPCLSGLSIAVGWLLWAFSACPKVQMARCQIEMSTDEKKDTATWQNFVGNMKIPSENVAQSLLSLLVRYVTLDIYLVTDSVGYLLINKIEILVG